jgi:Flp pilus assembly protein TadG
MRKGIAGNQRGTTLLTFTLLLTALLGFVALAIEVGSWYVTRAELSKAVDAAALAGAANIASPNLNLITLSQDFGDANFAPGYLGTVASGSGAASYAVTYTNNTLSVTGSTTVQGLITQLFGIKTFPVSTMGVAEKNHVQIMLVLDCSESMTQAMSNLKTAANGFLEFFTPDQSEDQMGVVTFSTAATVNVPLEYNYVTAIQNVINAARATAYTNSPDAIAAAGAQLPVQTGTPNSTWKQQYIIFFTDGEPDAFTSTFVHGNTSYQGVVMTDAVATHQYSGVNTYLASPTTGNNLTINAVQTGKGQNESTCVVTQGRTTTYSTSWATIFGAYPPPSPYSTVGYCDIPQGNLNPPRQILANYIGATSESMGLANATALKARGVKIYTIGLLGDGGIDTTWLANISSGPNYAFVAPNSSQLQAIFNQIAKDIILTLVQ